MHSIHRACLALEKLLKGGKGKKGGSDRGFSKGGPQIVANVCLSLTRAL